MKMKWHIGNMPTEVKIIIIKWHSYAGMGGYHAIEYAELQEGGDWYDNGEEYDKMDLWLTIKEYDEMITEIRRTI